ALQLFGNWRWMAARTDPDLYLSHADTPGNRNIHFFIMFVYIRWCALPAVLSNNRLGHHHVGGGWCYRRSIRRGACRQESVRPHHFTDVIGFIDDYRCAYDYSLNQKRSISTLVNISNHKSIRKSYLRLCPF